MALCSGSLSKVWRSVKMVFVVRGPLGAEGGEAMARSGACAGEGVSPCAGRRCSFLVVGPLGFVRLLADIVGRGKWCLNY